MWHVVDVVCLKSNYVPFTETNLLLTQQQRLPKLIGDGRRFLQVLINLVKNALKFTNKGFVEICAAYDELNQMICAQVKDSGLGIKPDEKQKLFSKFGKLLRTSHLNHDGIGLGLTIVKQIVDRSGGTVTVDSGG